MHSFCNFDMLLLEKKSNNAHVFVSLPSRTTVDRET